MTVPVSQWRIEHSMIPCVRVGRKEGRFGGHGTLRVAAPSLLTMLTNCGSGLYPFPKRCVSETRTISWVTPVRDKERQAKTSRVASPGGGGLRCQGRQVSRLGRLDARRASLRDP